MSDTGFKVCGTVESESWSLNFTQAYLASSNNGRALATGTTWLSAEISDFAFGLPAGVKIEGIEALAEISCNDANTAYFRLRLSWDDGEDWVPLQLTSVAGSTDTNKTLGGATDTWGREWTAAEFADGTFRVKVEGRTDNAGSSCRLDYLAIKVHYSYEGRLASTLGAVTLVATANESLIEGALAKTLGAVTLESEGNVSLIGGALAGTLGAVTLESNAHFTVSGTLAGTLGAVTLAGFGSEPREGALSKTLGAVTLTGMAGKWNTKTFTMPYRFSLGVRRHDMVAKRVRDFRVPVRALELEVKNG